MRLLPHILLAFLAIGLQRGLDALLSVGSARADLVMIAAAFTATCFPRPNGAIAAALIGLAYDVSGSGPIGLYAASIGLGGLAASVVPPMRWSRLVAAVVAGVVVAAVTVWVLGLLRRGFIGDPGAAEYGLAGMTGTVLLSGMLAVGLSLPMWKWRHLFVVEAARF